MNKKTTQTEFARGLNDRKSSPLPHGEYKLLEMRRHLESILSEIKYISEYVLGRRDKWGFTCCTVEDKHIWLKRLPLLLSYMLGYMLIPGVVALKRDGVKLSTVQSALRHLEPSTMGLVDRLELVRLTIANNIEVEYERMRNRCGLLEPLVEDSIQLTESALGLVDMTKSGIAVTGADT